MQSQFGLHGDAGSFSHSDSLYTISWNSLVGRGETAKKRFLPTVLRKSDMVKGETLDAIFRIFSWSVNAMLERRLAGLELVRQIPGEWWRAPRRRMGSCPLPGAGGTGPSILKCSSSPSGTVPTGCVGYAAHLPLSEIALGRIPAPGQAGEGRGGRMRHILITSALLVWLSLYFSFALWASGWSVSWLTHSMLSTRGSLLM